MIDSKELRIGNLVLFDTEVDTIQSLGRKYCDGENRRTWSYDRLHPIPLTEELLVKLGFDEYVDFGNNTGDFDLIPLQGFSYNIVTKKVRVMHSPNPTSYRLKTEINYVHQLQNLYFALTGQELELK